MIAPRHGKATRIIERHNIRCGKEGSMIKTVALTVFLATFCCVGAAFAEVAVEEAVACTSVLDRAPAGTASEFSPDVGKIYVYTRIVGMSGTGAVTHRWIFGGETVAEVTLEVKGSPWRTWSSKNIVPHQTGAWKVEVVGEDGTVLKTLEFTVGQEPVGGKEK
jgi:hypothetical protein